MSAVELLNATTEQAEAKLTEIMDTTERVYAKIGAKREFDKLVAVDDKIQDLVRQLRSRPATTRHNYADYASVMGDKNPSVMAIVLWRNGGDPRGVLAALVLKLEGAL